MPGTIRVPARAIVELLTDRIQGEDDYDVLAYLAERILGADPGAIQFDCATEIYSLKLGSTEEPEHYGFGEDARGLLQYGGSFERDPDIFHWQSIVEFWNHKVPTT